MHSTPEPGSFLPYRTRTQLRAVELERNANRLRSANSSRMNTVGRVFWRIASMKEDARRFPIQAVPRAHCKGLIRPEICVLPGRRTECGKSTLLTCANAKVT